MNEKFSTDLTKKSTYIANLDDLMPLIKEQLSKGQSIRFSPKGKSMLPMLREDRDSVVLSPVPKRLKKYDLPLYQRVNGQYVLHRIIEVDKDGQFFTCIGDNQFVREQGIRKDQMIAVVTAFERKRKMYKTTNLFYQFYCRIWHYSRKLRHFCIRGKRWIDRRLAG